MTAHDAVRRDRALEARGGRYDSREAEIEALHDAVLGLQSTDDPELCPLAHELYERLRVLEAAEE
jgi:hypothetical protein